MLPEDPSSAFSTCVARNGLPAQACYTDARHGDLTAGFADSCGHADDGEAGRRLEHFLVTGSNGLVLDRHDDGANNFAGFERGGEGVDEEIGDRDFAFGFRGDQLDFGFERQKRSGIVGRGIGMRDTAADGAHVADLQVADVRSGLGQQRAL